MIKAEIFSSAGMPSTAKMQAEQQFENFVQGRNIQRTDIISVSLSSNGERFDILLVYEHHSEING